jgi:hypothetical protein
MGMPCIEYYSFAIYLLAKLSFDPRALPTLARFGAEDRIHATTAMLWRSEATMILFLDPIDAYSINFIG